MEVIVKIDKFGRILIPKKIREAKGYVCGTELSLVMEPDTAVLRIVPAEKITYALEPTDWGWMTFSRNDGQVNTYSPTELIAEGRELRRAVVAGEQYADGSPRNAES